LAHSRCLFACLRPRLRSSHERRRDRNTPTKAVAVVGGYSKIPSTHERTIAAGDIAIGRARPSGRRRPAACRHRGGEACWPETRHPRVASRSAVLDPERQRANAVDLVSQGRPPSARCGCLVEPAVLAASELVGNAPGAERIEPSRAEQPGRACSSFFGIPSHHATVEDNNPMLVVMKMLMSSDAARQAPRRQPGPRTAGAGDDAATKGLGACRKNPGRTRPRLSSTSLA
jgi:hypothetical protein